MKIQKSKIDWDFAIEELTIAELGLLTFLNRTKVDCSDKNLVEASKLGITAYKTLKSSLISKGYLKVAHVGRHKYKYIIGNDKIVSDDNKYESKTRLNEMVENHTIVNLREPDAEEIAYFKKHIAEVKSDKVFTGEDTMYVKEELDSLTSNNLLSPDYDDDSEVPF